MTTARIHDRWPPGMVGDIAALHARSYAASYGFGAAFERKVAAEFGELVERFDPHRDFLRAAGGGSRFLGSIAVDGHGAKAGAAQLRFFILDPALRGQGFGRCWLREAVAHARGAGFRRMSLWTLGGLEAAAALYEYEDAGFRLEPGGMATQFGTPAPERRFGLAL